MVGLDLGQRRIGVAVSDGTATLASPWGTLERSGDAAADRAAVVAVVDEVEAARVVVGLPLSLNGRRGPAARATEAEVAALGEALASRGVEVEAFDERFTTVSADRALAQAGVAPRRRRLHVDAAAATVLLQAWLDGRARRGHG